LDKEVQELCRQKSSRAVTHREVEVASAGGAAHGATDFAAEGGGKTSYQPQTKSFTHESLGTMLEGVFVDFESMLGQLFSSQRRLILA